MDLIINAYKQSIYKFKWGNGLNMRYKDGEKTAH